MERGGGSYRERGYGGRGRYYGGGRGRARGRARDGSADHQPPYQAPIGQGQSGANWNPTNSQVGPYQDGDARGGQAGGGRGRRGGWVPRLQPERPNYSYEAESASGRGGGTGRGRGRRPFRPVAAPTLEPEDNIPALPPSPPPPPQSVPDSVVMNVSEQLASTSLSSENQNRHNPIMRPDKGGRTALATVRLNVNHFRVKFNPESIIRHYDVDVRQLESPRNGRPAYLSKPLLSSIRKKLFTDNPQLPLLMTAYDGEKNIFSAVRLPEGEFKVESSEGEDVMARTYIFSIKLVNELKLCKLRDYLSRKAYSIPRDILQGMDVVMKENPVMHMVPVGRSFHPYESCPEDDLGYGITASRGIRYSLKPTYQGLALCLDYSVLAFRKKMPVLDFLAEHIPDFNVNSFRRFRRHVDQALKNLKVNVTHRRTKQKYVIVGLTRDDTRNVSFPDANDPQVRVRLVDYFREKYDNNIRYLDIPCLDLSRNNRMNYVPMEYCVLAEGQIYPKDDLDRDAAFMLKDISLAKPYERQSKICGMVQSKDGPCGY
ncbi:hypothetical protein Goari_004886, partial [Gossypium aridum]|nr:hypothetical protein [Gossypium aridum]